MRKLIFFFITFFIIPVFAYEIYSQQDYSYTRNSQNLLFVVDFSNSMGEFLNHKKKSESVKTLIKNILPQIDAEINVGMRVYGHNCNLFAFNACRNSELLIPIEKNNTQKINQTISKLHPRGMTPITYSLKQAVNKDFSNINGNKHIILLTDGGENCDESPCEYVISMVKGHKDINIDVIAFDVKDDDDLTQLKCTANVTGGKFIEAKTSAQLFNAMQELISPHKQVEAILYSKD